jgi:hypothetical protein
MHTRIWGSHRLGPLLVAVVAAVALTACGSSASSNSSSSSGSAQSLLKQTFSSGHTVKSGVLGFGLTMTPTGSSTLTTPITLSLTGPFQSRGSGKLPSSDFTIGISALGKQGSFGVISTGTSGYVTLEGASYQLPQADFQRLEQSFSSVESSSGAGASSPGLSELGINPLHWLTNPSIVGTETVSGTSTTHIRAGVDVSVLLSDLNKFLAKTAKTTSQTSGIPTSIPPATESKIAAAVKNATVDVWTGKSDQTLRKLAINLTLPVTGQASTLLGGLSSAGIELSLQYSKLGQTQSIPTPGNVQPYSGFTAKVRSIVQQLEGSLGAAGLGSGAASTSTSTSGSAAPGSAAPANVSKYTKCIQQASGDVTKMQKCASLLNGK